MFAEIFADLLVEHNLNKRSFSSLSGIPYPTVIGWTNLNRLPDYNALIKIADFFQCSADYLLGRQDEFGHKLFYGTQKTKDELEFLSHYKKLNKDSQELLLQLMEKIQSC